MITKKQARTIVKSIVKELSERSMGGSKDSYIDVKPEEVGELVETMLTPVTMVDEMKQSHKEEDP